MRVKTSKNVLDMLPEVKNFLGFENNAQVLKLAISFTINENSVNLETVVEDGFDIDTNVLFGEDKEYYEYLIKSKFNQDVDKHFYAMIIEYGMEKLHYYIKISKTLNQFTKKVLEELCI